MNENKFYLDFNVTGVERKRLVEAISSYKGADARYLGAPSFAYEIGRFHIDRNGIVSFDDRADNEEIGELIEALTNQGFVSLASNLGGEDENITAASADVVGTYEDEGLTICLPLNGFNPDSLDRLTKLVNSKAALIRKALNTDGLAVQIRDDAVAFPWWNRMPEPDAVQAYSSFIAALGKMAKESKRVNATEKDVESEKYAFRSFLLRLGFIGSDCKKQRKLLLRNLSGSAAFPSKQKADAFNAVQKAKRDERKTTDQCEGVSL